jgi:hypothetical protein
MPNPRPEFDFDRIRIRPFFGVKTTAQLLLFQLRQACSVSIHRVLMRLNFLDFTSELILGHQLVTRPPMDRSSLLALDAS